MFAMVDDCDVRPSVPVLIFSGRFFTDVSTVNNDPSHFDVRNYSSNWHLLWKRPSQRPFEDNKADDMNGWWNPNGSGSFALKDCKVTNVIYADGSSTGPVPRDAAAAEKVDAEDPVLGLDVCGSYDSVDAKLVDLDPMNQMVPTIFGLHFNLGDRRVTSDDGGNLRFDSTLEPTPMRDMWQSVPGDHIDRNRCAVFQGLVTPSSFFNAGASRFFTEASKFKDQSKELGKDEGKDEGKDHPRFVLRLTIDAFNDISGEDGFLYGRVSGTLRPHIPNEPNFFDAGRVLRPVPRTESKPKFVPVNLMDAFVECHEVDGKRVHFLSVESGNSFACPTAGGSCIDQGTLKIVCKNHEIHSILDYTDKDWRTNTAGYMKIGLTSHALAALREEHQLQVTNGRDQPLLSEPESGYYVRADTSIYRFDPKEYALVKFYVTRFGRRVQAKIVIGFDSSTLKGPSGPKYAGVPQAAVKVVPIVPSPVSAKDGIALGKDSKMRITKAPDPMFEEVPSAAKDDLTAPDGIAATVSTDVHGVAFATINTGDPGNPRKYIDGQVYCLTYGVDTLPARGSVQNSSELVSILLHTGFTAPPNPSWIQDIAPIFEQYAILYPSMGRILNLADYADCMWRRRPLLAAFNVDIENPRHMPVSRDLSKAKRKMIVQWLDTEKRGATGVKRDTTKTGAKVENGDTAEIEHVAKNGATVENGDTVDNEDTLKHGPKSDPKADLPLYCDTKCKANLFTLLQTAIELEHATIPLYLTALYSIKPGRNRHVADTLRSVVMEEMVHMSAVCNILISIGGSPQIDKPNFVPKYPGPLPGGLRKGFVAHLRKCSIRQLRDFMQIEEPRELPEQQNGMLTGKTQAEQLTIGYLYDVMKTSLRNLSSNGEITFGNVDRQVAGAHYGVLTPVNSLQTAIENINLIVDEGEGCTPKGSKPMPTDGQEASNGLPELAHYYRFAEIVEGRRLVANGSQFGYTGEKIPFEDDGVYPICDDPDVHLLPKGSSSRLAAEGFNRRYQQLLNALHKTFNGSPEYLKDAISNMFQLPMYAERLMTLDSHRGDGTTAGISFQIPFDVASHDA